MSTSVETSERVPELTDPRSYISASMPCDIIMKGGITSGVVYPLAVCEIARTYQFRSIGGTSAGAIAAAVTAAAEYGRDAPGGGFAQIATLPDWLKTDDNLFHLFQPQPGTTPIFRLLTAAIGSEQGRRGRIILAFARNLWLGIVIGAVPGVALAVVGLTNDGIDRWELTAAAALVILGAVAGAVINGYLFTRRAMTAIAENFYGICNGFQENEADRPQALTAWLSDYIDSVAGVTERTQPLTFGDLWGDSAKPEDRNINLEVMSTNLTMGRPFRLPFDNDRFYFHPAEFRKLFPHDVVEWMVTHTRKEDTPEERDKYLPLLPLPSPANMPVVVAARMSLSFPIVVSAIPLYAIDFSRKVEHDSHRRPERCWFSDGGIASNFPIHFFDRPLPRWPTFAINLRSFHPDYPPSADESLNAFLVSSNRGGTQEWWDHFENVPGFMMALRNTMQNWLDNLQTYQPGNRDRIAHINLDKREGGMNLKMEATTLDRLRERGRWAGVKLRDRFSKPPATPSSLSWDNHRWVRYRTAMANIEEFFDRLRVGYNDTTPGDRSYADLITRASGEAPTSYAFSASQAQDALAATTTLMSTWQQTALPFADDPPSPRPQLRSAPRY